MDALIKGITLGLLLAISVGPIVFTVIKQSIANGHKGGLIFIAGISLSDILLVVFSNLFTNLFDLLNAHKKVLAVIASVFLIAVGIFYIFFKKTKVDANGDVNLQTRHYTKLFVTGFIMNIFNPGIIIFWLTTATTFVGDSVNQRIVIFTTALIIALTADVAKVLLASKIRQRMTAKNIHLVNQVNGIVLVAFGVFIIFFG
ncbi:MAG TPA: LysE family transporter [Flavisolibacter sp.]|jgi:threonine/homoserine/homoserine lactone efflux protein|nr:LysE family transporter [Flavisolibacter sp.]